MRQAVSESRINQIVEAVANGLDSDDSETVRRKRLLRTFGELDDDEIALLNAYGRSYGGADRTAFDHVNRPPPAHLGSNQIEIDHEKLYEAGKEHLLRLGLLKKSFPFVKRGELPEFDRTIGDFKHSTEISYLGRMLLREIGLPTPFDLTPGEDEEAR